VAESPVIGTEKATGLPAPLAAEPAVAKVTPATACGNQAQNAERAVSCAPSRRPVDVPLPADLDDLAF
jgi:hypothetical protein